MDHFEIEANMSEDEKERLHAALQILREGAREVARRHDLCPVCLIYALADLTADAEEAGLLRHAGGTQH